MPTSDAVITPESFPFGIFYSVIDQASSLDAMVELDANDYVELVWVSSDGAMALFAYPAPATDPAMPSAYATVSMVIG
jgi:hypothetical protein